MTTDRKMRMHKNTISLVSDIRKERYAPVDSERYRLASWLAKTPKRVLTKLEIYLHFTTVLLSVSASSIVNLIKEQ